MVSNFEADVQNKKKEIGLDNAKGFVFEKVLREWRAPVQVDMNAKVERIKENKDKHYRSY